MSEKDKNQEATISLLNSHYYQQRRIAGYHARNEIEFLKIKFHLDVLNIMVIRFIAKTMRMEL